MEGMIPNFSHPILCSHSESVEQDPAFFLMLMLAVLVRLHTYFRGRAIRLFNSLPKLISCTISWCCCYLPTPLTLVSGGGGGGGEGESDDPACGPPASLSLHLASSSITSAGSTHKSSGDNVVRM